MSYQDPHGPEFFKLFWTAIQQYTTILKQINCSHICMLTQGFDDFWWVSIHCESPISTRGINGIPHGIGPHSGPPPQTEQHRITLIAEQIQGFVRKGFSSVAFKVFCLPTLMGITKHFQAPYKHLVVQNTIMPAVIPVHFALMPIQVTQVSLVFHGSL